jgi:molybdenum cofactor biosynthesis protein B
MPGIDQTRQFVPLKIAVLTISDTRSLADDKSGSTLAERIEKAGHTLGGRAIIEDDIEEIRKQLRTWIADLTIDVIITTGGTGFTGRDVTPEAAEPLFEKRMDGFSTAFHMVSHAKIGSSTIQSRATAGVAPAGLSLPAVQFRRVDAAARRAPAAPEGEGRDSLIGGLLGFATRRLLGAVMWILGAPGTCLRVHPCAASLVAPQIAAADDQAFSSPFIGTPRTVVPSLTRLRVDEHRQRQRTDRQCDLLHDPFPRFGQTYRARFFFTLPGLA